MPYGSPFSDSASNAIYGVGIQHKTEAEFFFGVTYAARGTDGFTEQERDDLFQAFVDFIDGSTDYQVTGASKQYPTTEEITPTP